MEEINCIALILEDTNNSTTFNVRQIENLKKYYHFEFNNRTVVSTVLSQASINDIQQTVEIASKIITNQRKHLGINVQEKQFKDTVVKFTKLYNKRIAIQNSLQQIIPETGASELISKIAARPLEPTRVTNISVCTDGIIFYDSMFSFSSG